MSTGVLITLIICGMLISIVAMILITAIIFQKRQQKTIEKAAKNFDKNFGLFKEDE